MSNGATYNESASRIVLKAKKPSSSRRIGVMGSFVMMEVKMVLSCATARPPGVNGNRKLVKVIPVMRESGT